MKKQKKLPKIKFVLPDFKRMLDEIYEYVESPMRYKEGRTKRQFQQNVSILIADRISTINSFIHHNKGKRKSSNV